ncbi:hypothetical protein Q31a_16390 [Aureliella helgolandensis]|uniref:Uncharacterized protein n=1 Tax=Aureliella helgolandensis TaxID=2527968 RepID=A0A518G420_9BACT|nr:hypothetical protein Q31a_16390 [Aureliella helgolandensis]
MKRSSAPGAVLVAVSKHECSIAKLRQSSTNVPSPKYHQVSPSKATMLHF